MSPPCSPGLSPKQQVFLLAPTLSPAGMSSYGLIFVLIALPSASARFRSPEQLEIQFLLAFHALRPRGLDTSSCSRDVLRRPWGKHSEGKQSLA